MMKKTAFDFSELNWTERNEPTNGRTDERNTRKETIAFFDHYSFQFTLAVLGFLLFLFAIHTA